MCLAQGQNAVTLVRLKPETRLSPVKHSTTALPYNSSFDKGQSVQMHSLARIFSVSTHKVVNIDEDFDHVPGLANNF